MIICSNFKTQNFFWRRNNPSLEDGWKAKKKLARTDRINKE